MPAALHERVPQLAKVLTPSGECSAAEIRTTRSTVAGPFHSRYVALSGDASFLFKWLAALDGTAKRIVVVPQSADPPLVDLIRDAGGVDLIISQTRLGLEAWNGCEIVVDSPLDQNEAIPLDVDAPTANTDWVLATSGTTRTPKLVAHHLGSLTRTMKIDARFAEYRWGLMYDPARFAGLQVLLQALLNGATLLAPQLDWSLAEQVNWLAEHHCDAMSATPTLWRKMLMTPGFDRLSLRQITLGGEIADASTISALAKRFPNARITHVYASTEAGVGFAVHDGQPGFPEQWLTTGVRDVQMKLGDNHCLWVLPKHIDQKYLGTNEQLLRADGWIDTGDVLRIEHGRALFCGRLNGSINIGGNKVYPEEIESAVLEVEGVGAALARAKASSVMGNLVEVLVVPNGLSSENLPARIKTHCRQKLDSYKVPAFIRIVDQLDTSAAGKTLRTP